MGFHVVSKYIHLAIHRAFCGFHPCAYLLAGALLLSGCTYYPEEGQGGMAEHYYSTLSPVLPDQPLTPQQGMRFEWELLARQLDILVLEGAKLCFPASVYQARQLQDRIVRELYGGLEFDAANDIIIQRAALERLENQLDAVKGSGACLPNSANGDISASELAATIYELLNIDNQFAFNSPAVNPKYMGHLAEAAHLLRDLPQYRLHITGHADSIGTHAANQTLSLERAKQVRRYLLIFGVPATRISIAAVGATDPLFEGNEPQVRLVNRRVSIELIEQTSGNVPLESATSGAFTDNNTDHFRANALTVDSKTKQSNSASPSHRAPVYRDINAVLEERLKERR
ncbi:OmpA family protein [Vibrio sp. SM6]|uniref:OmpA family protein n=1 Tax=Vibrio agarilyticus TaxID=2726741 RepID=A0A7X8YGY8_9VIBR|nr:OmpA family protein [Vibrio agarilyticus]